MVNPAIVVAAYNRLDSLKRLIGSLMKGKYNVENIPLIISIDYHKDNLSLIEYANSIVWVHGEILIITHEQNLGLRKHILKCGDLVNKYENIILLEDDLFLSPYFYQFCLEAMQFYQCETHVAGVSLYSYEKSEGDLRNFKPLYNEYDIYFMQFPSSRGQLWTKKQWIGFMTWYNINKNSNNFIKHLPRYIASWPETSWKKYFASYMVECNKYFVYPKIGLSTNFGEIGQHYSEKTNVIQTDLLSTDLVFKFEEFEQSVLKYDITFELTYNSLILLNPRLAKYPEFTLNFYNLKNMMDSDLVMTQSKSSNPLQSFSNRMQPLINNILYEIEGEGIVLSKAKDIIVENKIDKKNFLFYLRFNIIKYFKKIAYNSVLSRKYK